MNIERQLALLVDDALDADPRRALVAVRHLRTEHLDWLEQRAVMLARRERWSWAQIGRLLGVSKQNTHAKFRHLDRLGPPSRPPRTGSDSPPSRAERLVAEFDDRRRRRSELETWEASGTDIVPW